MKLTSALLLILLGAAASGPALARSGHSVVRSGSPMFHGSHFHSSVHSGSVVVHDGHFHSPVRSSFVVIHNDHFNSPVHSSFVVIHNGHFHRHFRSSVVIIGAPFFAPFYYPAPYYYYPPVAAMPYSPPEYIEQGGAVPEQSQGYWYYCTDANAYYPYVKECPGGWQRVTPQPPAPN